MNFNFQNRQEIKKEYKVNLEDIFASDKAWYQTLEDLKKELPSLEKYKENIMDSADNLLNLLKKTDQIDITAEKLYIYANVKKDCELNNKNYLKMFNEIITLITTINMQTSFIIPELLKSNEQDVLALLQTTPNLLPYEKTLKDIYRYKQYTLSEKEEKIISALSEPFVAFDDISNILNNSEIKYGSIKVDGKNQEITSTNSILFLTHENRQIRKKSNIKKCRKLQEFKETFTTNFLANLKALNNEAKLRGFTSYQESSLYADKMDISKYNSIIALISSNTAPLHRFHRILKKCLNLNELYSYDLYAPFLKTGTKKYSIADAQNMIKDAFKVYPKQYQDVINMAFEKRWIDYCTYPGRSNMCYNICGYETHPIIFLNYLGNIRDVSTLTHELGHAVHSYFSINNNDYPNSEYTLLVAEIASLTNEILFAKYFIQNSTNQEEKLQILLNLIEVITDNFYDATKQAEFESTINLKVASNESLSSEDICQTWTQLNQKYYGDDLKFIKQNSISWVRIPHFYSPFYTYKYAVGVSGACYVAYKILNSDHTFMEKYINFLKSGGQKYPLEQLTDLGIDLTDPNFFLTTAKTIEELLDEFEKVYKEVKNNE